MPLNQSKRINRKTFPNISSEELPHSKRVIKIFTFSIKMVMFEFFIKKNGNFKKILKTKSDPNIHQNAPNCII